METKENYTFEELKEIIARLRAEDGCPGTGPRPMNL